jgi:hypothetical protein
MFCGELRERLLGVLTMHKKYIHLKDGAKFSLS